MGRKRKSILTREKRKDLEKVRKGAQREYPNCPKGRTLMPNGMNCSRKHIKSTRQSPKEKRERNTMSRRKRKRYYATHAKCPKKCCPSSMKPKKKLIDTSRSASAPLKRVSSNCLFLFISLCPLTIQRCTNLHRYN